MAAKHVRVARCDNVIERSDFTASPCTGLLRFAPGDVQAKCDACGGWCGHLVADYISDLHVRLLDAIRDTGHRVVRFHDLDEVPVGSVGYFSPSGQHVFRDERGWLHDGRRFEPRQGTDSFTAHSGPANDELLAELLERALVPEHGLLVSFGTECTTESDWELGCGTAWCDLVKPQLLAHRLEDHDLAYLYYAIEQYDGLQESDAYGELDKQIEELSEGPAEELRRQAAAEPLGLLDRRSEDD